METILVTGSTDGIGKATAKALAERGCEVIVHGRNEARAQSAQRDLINTTGNPNIRTVSADFSSLAQVRDMANEINDLPKLDVLINNAAIATNLRTLTEDGFVCTWPATSTDGEPIATRSLPMPCSRASWPASWIPT